VHGSCVCLRVCSWWTNDFGEVVLSVCVVCARRRLSTVTTADRVCVHVVCLQM
jgi:hypothetical protein